MKKSNNIRWGVKLVNGGGRSLETDLNNIQFNPNMEIVTVVSNNNNFYIIYKEYKDVDNDIVKAQQFQ